MPDVETEAQTGKRVTQGHRAIRGRGEPRSQAPRSQPGTPTTTPAQPPGACGRESPCQVALQGASPLPPGSSCSSIRQRGLSNRPSLRPPPLQVHVVPCSRVMGKECHQLPTPRALGSHTHGGTCSLGDRHRPSGRVQSPGPEHSPSLGHCGKPPLLGQFREAVVPTKRRRDRKVHNRGALHGGC